MKKSSIPRLLQTILFAALAALFLADVVTSAEPGRTEKNGFHVVTLEGSPYDMGLQQGKLFRDEIQEVYKIYLEELLYKDWIKSIALLKGDSKTHKNPSKAMLKFAKGVESYIPEEYKEEMKGIAEGAGLEYEQVLNMSVHVDYLATIFCSTFVASGDATADGKLIEGRNLDWAKGKLKEMDRHSTIAVFKPDRGHHFVSIIYPGIVGVFTAVNDKKLTAEVNFSMSKENAETGMPILIIMRHLVQNAGTLDEAEQLLRNTGRIAGYNITVADGKTNDARLIEIASYGVGALGLTNNSLVSTNHFITEQLTGGNFDYSYTSSKPSPERFARLKELIEKNFGKIDPEIAISMMQDDGVQVDGTVQTVIFKPADDLIWVWARNREQGDFAEFNVAELLGKQAVEPGAPEPGH
ncbi:MAG: C45 family peptidase [bacterium]